MKTLVVNLFGVPGSGKSTGAAYIFARLKMKGINAELVTEYAKDKVWEENNEVFRNQAYLFGKQSYRLSRLDGKVDVIVTDSPLPLSILYNEDERLNETFNQSVMDVFNSYNNMNFLLRRTKPYNPSGRRQTEAESDALGAEIIQLLNERHIYCKQVDGDIGGYDSIVDVIKKEFSSKSEPCVITPGQAIRYFSWMCRVCDCCDCPLEKFAEALKTEEIDCSDVRCKYHEDTAKMVQEWAMENGYLTEDLEETGKFDSEFSRKNEVEMFITPTFYMMQGLPGSGKSTIAEQIKNNSHREVHIHSSDALREEMFGSADIQDNANALFEELHRRIRADLNAGIDVIYDATNIHKKKRVAFIESLSQIVCRKVNVCVMTPYEICIERNAKRERIVPEQVIRKMYLNWSPPHYHEGFDDIELFFSKAMEPKIIDELFDYMNTFDQENSHHSLSLGEHCLKARDYLLESKIHKESSAPTNLLLAALLHDIGKIDTKTRRNAKGKFDGDCHYYQHHCVGAYNSMLYLLGYQTAKILDIANLIYYHMHPYTSWKQSEKAKERDRKLIGEEMFEDVNRLHEADIAAH